jgi:hypothetical protein
LGAFVRDLTSVATGAVKEQAALVFHRFSEIAPVGQQRVVEDECHPVEVASRAFCEPVTNRVEQSTPSIQEKRKLRLLGH